MTKRVLSLLLTLVMVLSLCVPAFSAEDFEAEPTAEAVEEVPAAPVEPVAPEAEGPVEEEPVEVDEPAAAAITADEPMTIAATDQTTEAKKAELNDAIKSAESYLSMVDAHEADDPNGALKSAYDAAVRLQREIEIGGIETTTDTMINSAIAVLTEAEEDLVFTGKALNASAIVTALGASNSYCAALNTWCSTGTYKALKAIEDDIAEYYQPNYVAALLKAVKEAEAYQKTYSADPTARMYKAWYTANKALTDAAFNGTAAEKASLPTADNAATLRTLINDTKAKLDSGNYIDGAPAAGYPGIMEYLEQNGGILLDKYTNEFKEGTKYNAYRSALHQIQWVVNNYLLVNKKLVHFTGYRVGVNQERVRVYYAWVGENGATDNATYGIKCKIGWGEDKVVGSTFTGASLSTEGSILVNAPTDAAHNGKFLKGEQITFTLCKVENGTYTIVETLYIIVDPEYSGPLFKGAATYDAMANTITGKLSYATDPAGKYTKATVVLLDADGNELAKSDVSDTSDLPVYTINTTKTTAVSGGVKDVVAAAGTYTLRLDVTETGKGVVKNRSTTTVTVPALERYVDAKPVKLDGDETIATVSNAFSGKTGINNLKTLIAAAKAIGDVVLVDDTYYEDTATAKALLAQKITDGETIVNAAASTADTSANRGKVDKAIGDIASVMAYLEEAADVSGLEDLIAEAKALDESDYTPQSWFLADIASAIAKAEKFLKDEHSADEQSDVTVEIGKLQKAMEELEPVKADKTALNDSIKAAETALKDKDKYTEESVKAVDTALAAARTAAANAKATQTQVDDAKKALDDAVKGLTPKTGVPTVPAGWTGWKQDAAGAWYYFRNGEMKKDYWVTDSSKHNLWYHVGSDGKMTTGFQFIKDKTHGEGWYMLQSAETNGMQGTGTAGWGWFVNKNNGHYGDCTWTKAWGDYNAATGVWADGASHR